MTSGVNEPDTLLKLPIESSRFSYFLSDVIHDKMNLNLIELRLKILRASVTSLDDFPFKLRIKSKCIRIVGSCGCDAPKSTYAMLFSRSIE